MATTLIGKSGEWYLENGAPVPAGVPTPPFAVPRKITDEQILAVFNECLNTSYASVDAAFDALLAFFGNQIRFQEMESGIRACVIARGGRWVGYGHTQRAQAADALLKRNNTQAWRRSVRAGLRDARPARRGHHRGTRDDG